MTELDKWALAQPKLAVLRDFMEWCAARKIELGEPTPSGRWLQPLLSQPEEIFVKFLEIDTAKLERERSALLARAKIKATNQ